MASACALAIISGIGFLFGIQKSLRAFLNPLFTGVFFRGSPLQSLLRKASSPKGEPLDAAANFPATAEAVPLGKVASP